MSAVKFQCPPYKLFEPDYHPQKPIIVGVDDRLESPETLTLRYEEAARVANGEEPRSDSSPRLLEMATYSKAQLPSMHAGYEPTRYQDAGYEQYPTQSFPTQPQTEKFAQLNQQSFASNNGVAPYMPTGPTVLSCQPTTGGQGTKVYVKLSSQYDLFSLSSPIPFFFLLFGNQKCPAQDISRDVQDSSGYTHTCSAEAPQFLVTGAPSSTVPVSFLVEGPSGEEISRTAVGTFQYLEGSGDEITGATKMPKHDNPAPGPGLDQASTSPKAGEPRLQTEAPTNNYDYPAPQGAYPSTFPAGNNEMISTYRTSSFTEPQYHRRSGPGWSAYPTTLGSTGRGPLGLDPTLSGRPSLTPLPGSSAPPNGAPQLIRTSTIANANGGSGSYHPISLYSSKAVLKIVGKLDSMAEKWTQEEWENRRRIVVFRKSQTGSTLTTTFRACPVNERPPNSICVSCIWWQEKGDCYVTSVDTIHLLEQLVASPNRFSVEEKNRIRRNLEGFHPQTVSKAKAESEEFFKIIMAFPNPKPRNIEKDVKVFPWKVLEPALKKIIGKYSASPSSTLPPANMMAPVNTAYAALPTPPGPSMAPSQHDAHSPYPVHPQHDPMPSPRSLSGSQPTWTPYAASGPAYSTAPSRTLSPSIRNASPQQQQQQHQHQQHQQHQQQQLPQPPLRINTTPLPSVSSYDSRPVTTGLFSTPLAHPHSTATPPRWDSTPTSYAETAYPSLPSQAQASHPVYSSAAYSDSGPRA